MAVKSEFGLGYARELPDLAGAGIRTEDLVDGFRWRPDTLAQNWSEGRWIPHPHHEVTAHAIVECIAAADGRLLIQEPPRHGKTELTSIWTPTWFLHLWPHKKVIVANYGASLAAEWGGMVRNILTEHGYPYGVEIAHDTRAKDSWQTLQGGGMWTAGIGGSLTGRGADLLIIDDPVKDWEEASSIVYRERAWNWYNAVALTRLAPGGSVIVVQTRWNQDDLSGRLETASIDGTGDSFRVLRLPGIATEDQSYVRGIDATTGRIKVWTRRKGEALWPTAFPKVRLDALRKALGPVLFAALYQQAPSPLEGAILKRGWWRRWNGLPDPQDRTAALISVDSSFKGKDDSDFVVIQVWWRYGARKYLVEQVRDRMEYVVFKRTLRDVMLKHPECRIVLIEDSANGPAVISDLSQSFSGMVPRPAKGSKESRAIAISGDVESGNVYLPDAAFWPGVVDFIEECALFPNGANDDQVDAFTQAMLEWPNVIVAPQGEYSPMDALRGRGR